MGGYTRAVSGQRLPKHVPAARRQILNNTTVGLQQWKSYVLYVVLVERLKPDEFWSLVSCMGVCEEGTLAAGGRGIAIVGAITRKRLVTD
jgi:hypothetical protein